MLLIKITAKLVNSRVDYETLVRGRDLLFKREKLLGLSLKKVSEFNEVIQI